MATVIGIPLSPNAAVDMAHFKQGTFFWQHMAPTHHTLATDKYLQRDWLAFIAPQLWPPYSPDLNPVDYGKCRQRLSNMHRFGWLETLTKHWVGRAGSCRHCCSHSLVASLSLGVPCIRASGGHCEHCYGLKHWTANDFCCCCWWVKQLSILSLWLFVCLVFNGTYSTNRLYCTIEVWSISRRAGGQYKRIMQLNNERIQ